MSKIPSFVPFWSNCEHFWCPPIDRPRPHRSVQFQDRRRTLMSTAPASAPPAAPPAAPPGAPLDALPVERPFYEVVIDSGVATPPPRARAGCCEGPSKANPISSRERERTHGDGELYRLCGAEYKAAQHTIDRRTADTACEFVELERAVDRNLHKEANTVVCYALGLGFRVSRREGEFLAPKKPNRLQLRVLCVSQRSATVTLVGPSSAIGVAIPAFGKAYESVHASSGYEAATRLVARYFHADAIEVTMTNIGFEPSDVSYVRWAGARGSNDSIVAPLNVAMAFLRDLCVSGSRGLRKAELTRLVDSLDRARQAQADAQDEAQQANGRVAELEQQVADAERRVETLEAVVREPASVDSVAQIDALEARLSQLRDAETVAEDAMCLEQLRVLFKRVRAPWLTRDGFGALYIGQYHEILDHFSRHVTVSCAQIISWLCEHQTGKRFWLALCVNAGLEPSAYDPNVFQVEHVHNAAWGGCDHPLNFMVLWSDVNNSVEFRTGPCHLKMIMLGRRNFEAVQRFARWNIKAPAATARATFVHDDKMPTTCILPNGLRQTTITLCGKRERVAGSPLDGA